MNRIALAVMIVIIIAFSFSCRDPEPQKVMVLTPDLKGGILDYFRVPLKTQVVPMDSLSSVLIPIGALVKVDYNVPFQEFIFSNGAHILVIDTTTTENEAKVTPKQDGWEIEITNPSSSRFVVVEVKPGSTVKILATGVSVPTSIALSNVFENFELPVELPVELPK